MQLNIDHETIFVRNWTITSLSVGRRTRHTGWIYSKSF